MSLRNELLAQGYEEKANRVGTVYFIKTGKISAKRCTKCFTIKRIKYFNKSVRGLGGRIAKCSECKSAHTKSWRMENRDRVAAYIEDKKEERYEITKIWRIKNPEKVRKGKRKWAIDNRERRALSDQKRRAVKYKLPNNITYEEFESVGNYFGGTCALSWDSDSTHTDHAVPLDTGHGGTFVGNVYPLDGRLNESKGAGHLFEWFDSNAERFDLSQRKFDELIAYLAETNDMTAQEYRKYVDWCFDNPRVIDEATGELVFKDGPINERMTQTYEGVTVNDEGKITTRSGGGNR